jgi:hypothetical protein
VKYIKRTGPISDSRAEQAFYLKFAEGRFASRQIF